MMIYLLNLQDNKKLINVLGLHNYSFMHIKDEMCRIEKLSESRNGLIMHRESLILIDGYDLDVLLKLLKDNEIVSDYKAIVTRHNLKWTVFELMNELYREKMSFQKKRNV
ncbi:MAG: DUF3783 domain-containing protein [Erysipelotrichaceae bacterium]